MTNKKDARKGFKYTDGWGKNKNKIKKKRYTSLIIKGGIIKWIKKKRIGLYKYGSYL